MCNGAAMIFSRTSSAFRPFVAAKAAIPFLLLCLSGIANAHIWLTPEELDSAIRDIERSQRSIESADTAPDKAQASFELAQAASTLATFLNDEYAVHGNEQEELLAAAVEMASEVGVTIVWSDYHERYFYDGAGYERYVELAPDGPQAAESAYQLIELHFYQVDETSIEELAKRADAKRRFLDRFPDFHASPRVSMFLGIDYRDLWRQCRMDQDEACTAKYAQLAEEQFRSISTEYSKSEISEVARRMLDRFEKERQDASS
jgi:hypothetical protein